jgi:hypothetical protein
VLLVSLTLPVTAAGARPATGTATGISAASGTTGPVAACDDPGAPPVQGQGAVDRLEASTAGADRPGLRSDLLDDDSLWVDGCGMPFAVDPSPPSPPDGTTPDGLAPDVVAPGEQPAAAPGQADLPVAAAPPYPYANTFQLHSKPGSNRVIYLDFDGEPIPANSAWAVNFNGGIGWSAPGYDTDGQPSTFSNAERDVVQEVFQRVAEDYAPFDVDVTTQDPGAAAIDRTNSADQNFGTRALITDDTVIGDVCGCGGIAYVGVFGITGSSHAYYQPALIFAGSNLDLARPIAEAASHEVGHNFGLSHDGNPTDGAYYYGQGSWGPIMGFADYVPLSQWSKGEYANPTNTEDDLAIIANGAPVRADDHGSTSATATVLTPGPHQTATGLITTRTDTDLFRITAAGSTTITVNPAPVGPNLDIRIDLTDASGAAVASADPPVTTIDHDHASGLAASITRTLTAGTYYLNVDGVGWGSVTTTGYSDYASLGAYSVDVTTQVAGATVPSAPAQPTAVAGDAEATVTWVAPADGGAAIDHYVVTPTKDGVAQTPITTSDTSTSRVVTGLVNGSSYTFTVKAHNALGDGPASPASAAVVPTSPDTYFHPLVPGRVLDSRPGPTNIGDFSTPWSAGAAGSRDVQITGRAGVPEGADAVVLNVTVVGATAGSYLQLWPTGSAQPTYGSSLNFSPGQIVPNQVTVKLGTGGKIRVFNAVGTVHVIADVSGYYQSGSGQAFHPIVPGRVLDSRSGPTNIGAFSTPWSAGVGGIRDVTIGGLVGVPPAASGVVLNVTVVNPTAGSFLQLWPLGTTQPVFGSSLNFSAGQIVPNAVTVKLGTAGKVRVYNAVGSVDVIADVAGYFA